VKALNSIIAWVVMLATVSFIATLIGTGGAILAHIGGGQ
jgi:hypothetical protein